MGASTALALLLLGGAETFHVLPARPIVRHARCSVHVAGSTTRLVGTAHGNAQRARSGDTIGMSLPPMAFVVVVKRYHITVGLIVVLLVFARRAAERGQPIWPYWVREMPSRLPPKPSQKSTHLKDITLSYQRARIKDALDVLERYSQLPGVFSEPPLPSSPLPPTPSSPVMPPASESTSTPVLDPSAWTEQALQRIEKRPRGSSSPIGRYDATASQLPTSEAHERQPPAPPTPSPSPPMPSPLSPPPSPPFDAEDAGRGPRWTALVAAATSAGEAGRAWVQTSEPGVWKGSE